MNIALILAGGVGQRVGESIPKQFLTVEDVPIIVYTLAAFQINPDVDSIVVVSVEGWQEEIESYKERYGITKLTKVILGGDNSMQSIANGVFGIDANDDDIVIVHDSVRPLTPQETISDCVSKCKEFGNGCASIPLQETIVRTKDGIRGNVNIDRSEIMRVQTPQAYRYSEIRWIYEEAQRRGITESVYVNTLAMDLGKTIFFAKGSLYNIKVTTKADLVLLKMMLENDLVVGAKQLLFS